jgi:ATP-dependent helicase/nuclease subunit A
MAGAGTGKTKTLVERCLDCLERDGADLDELLVVTFTEAAAAEMRDRLRRAMEARAQMETDGRHPVTGNFWNEQLARFDLAHIGTLHGFCLRLVREHFYQLGLDPRLAMLDEGEARQLSSETLDEQFAAHYAGTGEFSAAVQELIQIHGGGRDENIRRLVLRLHHYAQARPDARGWLAKQLHEFSAAESVDWERWLFEAVRDWRDEWMPVLENLTGVNSKAGELAVLLKGLTMANLPRAAIGEILQRVVAADETWPPKRKIALRKPLKELFEEALFLRSLITMNNGRDPLVEDWSWIRRHMQTLIRLAEEFGQKFADRKRADGVLDFHDLEQFALELLWDFSTGKPTPVAGAWRGKLKFLFVDEYQDINAAQDKIIAALARDAGGANRFLVGDVKQSIYRFRLADPKIFRDYAQNWHGENSQTIPLAQNFRSREGILNFVNSVFRLVMREATGGVEYDEDAELKSGLSAVPIETDGVEASAPPVELLMRFKAGRNPGMEDESGGLAALDDAQREARLVAWRLKELVATGYEIMDGGKNRALAWRDLAILLRSPRGRSEVYMKEFERASIPLAVTRGGFYESAEILDLLNLLQLLDNPLQDVPCIAVLRSPLVALSLDELAEIRLAAGHKHFWTALSRTQKLAAGIQKETAEKIKKFLERFGRWRILARQGSLSKCLEAILTETLYPAWLGAQPRGAQRSANVDGFLRMAQQFDQFQRQGLYRFLKFLEAQREAEAEPEVPALAAENAVRLMSIHQSKGLEFPVVVLADLTKSFNEQDLRSEIIFDEKFGLCPRVKPPHTGRRYPSLPHWLAQRRQKRELRGEELRLLYVALTRARERLILTASITEKDWAENWAPPQPVTPQTIADSRCFADWLAMWFGRRSAECGSPAGREGALPELQWRVLADAELKGELGSETVALENQSTPRVAPAPATLRPRLDWSYPFAAATAQKAKSSVTALRREAEELDSEAEPMFPGLSAGIVSRRPIKGGKRKFSASEIGAVHHRFLQHMRLEHPGSAGVDFEAETNRLVQEAYLTEDERAALDLRALAAFWHSNLGEKIMGQAAQVRRELPFTARFSPLELEKIVGRTAESGLEKEFIVVQGVADLAVLLPEEVWLLDFKTDETDAGSLAGKIKTYTPQLLLYAAALGKIYHRRVTMTALHFLALNHTEFIGGSIY